MCIWRSEVFEEIFTCHENSNVGWFAGLVRRTLQHSTSAAYDDSCVFDGEGDEHFGDEEDDVSY